MLRSTGQDVWSGDFDHLQRTNWWQSRAWGLGRRSWWRSRHKLLYTGWMKNKALLHGTGNCAQHPVINHKGKEHYQFSSVAQSCPTLCNAMNRSTPGLPVHHQLPESTQTHVHWVGDAIQPSHPLWSPSPPAPNPSQHQGLFQWVNSSQEVAKVLEFQLQHVLPMNTQDWSPSGWTGWISLQSKGLSRVFSNTKVQKHQFLCTQLSSQSNSHNHIWPLEKP